MFDDEIIVAWFEMVDMASLVEFGQGEENIAIILFSLAIIE